MSAAKKATKKDQRLHITLTKSPIGYSYKQKRTLRALGLRDEAVRGSVRFGLGRFNDDDQVQHVVEAVCEAVLRLRGFSSLAP